MHIQHESDAFRDRWDWGQSYQLDQGPRPPALALASQPKKLLSMLTLLQVRWPWERVRAMKLAEAAGGAAAVVAAALGWRVLYMGAASAARTRE
jgi:hypothetical protein